MNFEEDCLNNEEIDDYSELEDHLRRKEVLSINRVSNDVVAIFDITACNILTHFDSVPTKLGAFAFAFLSLKYIKNSINTASNIYFEKIKFTKKLDDVLSKGSIKLTTNFPNYFPRLASYVKKKKIDHHNVK